MNIKSEDASRLSSRPSELTGERLTSVPGPCRQIVGASALLAVVRDEPDSPRCPERTAAPSRRMPAPTWFEAASDIDAKGDDLTGQRFDDAVRSPRIELMAFTPEHGERAREGNDIARTDIEPALTG